MCKTITISQDQLEERLKELTKSIREPIYRGLNHNSLEQYLNTGIMKPQDGSLSVGTGVFFTNNLSYANSFTGGIIVVADLETFKERDKVIDTRVPGFGEEIIRELKIRKPNCNGYEEWTEITRHDTITQESLNRQEYVYTRRVAVARDDLRYEIRILPVEIESAA